MILISHVVPFGQKNTYRPIAVRIVIQHDQDNITWYVWQAAENSGKSQSLIQVTEQALASVFDFIVTDAHSTIELFQQSMHSFNHS